MCFDVNVLLCSYFVVLGGICPSPLMSCMYCTFDVLYIYTASLWYCLSTAIKFALYQPLYPEFIVNYCFDIKRAAATFALFACTLNGKHKTYHLSISFTVWYQRIAEKANISYFNIGRKSYSSHDRHRWENRADGLSELCFYNFSQS